MNFSASLLFSTANSIFKIVNSAADECKANISKEGVSIAVVDPTNVALLSLDIPIQEFRSYEYAEEETQIGLLIDELTRYLETLSNNGVDDNPEVTISIQPESTDSGQHILQITCGFYQKTFKCPTSESVRKTPKPPKLEHPYKITINTGVIKNIVNIVKTVDDYIWFGVENKDGKPVMHFQSDEEGRRTFSAYPKAYIELQKEEHRDIRSMFSLDYLTDIIPKIPSDYVKILLDNDWPVFIQFTVGKATVCNWYQAPRIESD